MRMTDPQGSKSPGHSLLSNAKAKASTGCSLSVSKLLDCSRWCRISPWTGVWDGQLLRVERRRWIHWHAVLADQERLAQPP